MVNNKQYFSTFLIDFDFDIWTCHHHVVLFIEQINTIIIQ